MGKLRKILKWRFVRALQIWKRLPIRAQGGITVFIPIVAVLVSFGFAIYGNLSRTARQEDIERKFTAVRQYGDLLTLMVDAETGERGYILTQRDEFLEPYRIAVDEIPKTIEQLKEIVEAEPGEKPRLERIEGLSKIQELVNRQLANLKESQNFTTKGKSREELYEHLQNGKATMDEIRAAINTMQNKEETLLTERIEEINSIRNRDYIFIFIALLVGVIVRVVSFYLFDRGIVRRIQHLTENTDSILKGKSPNFNIKEKTDAVGMLEKNIVKVAERIENESVVQK